MQAEVSYSHPLDQLLKLGEVKRHGTGVDYAVLGIGSEHVPELIRMAVDADLYAASSDSSVVWAPVHAWWALAQFRAESAIVPSCDPNTAPAPTTMNSCSPVIFLTIISLAQGFK